MKRQLLATSLLLLAVCASAAEPSIDSVQCRQRWPWSPKVDIDFITSEANCYVSFSATWYGQSEPVPLRAGLSGADLIFSPGPHSVTWDPVAAGYGNELLLDFKITAATATETSRTWLVLDLVNKSYEYKDGTFTGADFNTNDYKQNKIVFRRVPAGTYTLGRSTAIYNMTWPDGAMHKDARKQSYTATFSSDYYIAIFKMTGYQEVKFSFSGSGQKFKRARSTFDTMRGYHTNRYTTAGVKSNLRANWPNDGFTVGRNSGIWCIREVFKDVLPEGFVIDLPTAAQWEAAARAGTSGHLWGDEGDETTTAEEMTAIFNRIAVWNLSDDNVDVGTKEPNAWGLYDTVGLYREYVLDWYNASKPAGGVDPVGSTTKYYVAEKDNYRRMTRGSSAKVTTISDMDNSSSFSDVTVASDTGGYRLVINTRNWTGKPIYTDPAEQSEE